jgi:hypothetical protein
MESKEQVDYILLIMNCAKYSWKAEIQKQTWLPQIPRGLKYYHVLGDDSLSTDFKFDNNLHILWVNTKDDYNSLPHKVISAYKAVSKTYQFKYLFKTDDDQRMIKNPTLFFNTITQLVEKNKSHYGGFVVDVQNPYLSSYHKVHKELPSNIVVQSTRYCSGRFYFLSVSAVKDVILKREDISKEYFEDYAIGYFLSENFKQNIFHFETHKIFQDIENNVIT